MSSNDLVPDKMNVNGTLEARLCNASLRVLVLFMHCKCVIKGAGGEIQLVVETWNE